jgi:hypothetical protein
VPEPLKPGVPVVVGRHVVALCGRCNRVVRIGRMKGGLHVCRR